MRGLASAAGMFGGFVVAVYLKGMESLRPDHAAWYQAARECAINQLAQAKHVLGDLSRIKRVVKVLGMVNAAPGFKDSPAVVHGTTELYYEVLGEKGVHARSAVGLQALPSDVAVEVETIFEVE